MVNNDLKQYEIPLNSVSCFIGRVCADVSDSFANDGIIWVDLQDLDGSQGGPNHGEPGSTQIKAIASWTLRAAYIAWKNPPNIKFKGKAKLKGKISMPNANLSNVTLSGGPPLMGVASPVPMQVSTPVAISAAQGTAKIEQASGAEIDMSTEDNFDIEITSQHAAQLPWCVKSDGFSEGDMPDEEETFIKAGDKALCMAVGNSLANLFVVDIFR